MYSSGFTSADPEEIFTINICRLCTTETKVIEIYSENAKQFRLESLIRQYIGVYITESDLLPTTICYDCLTHLLSIKNFVTKTIENQRKLAECLNAEYCWDDKNCIKPAERMAIWQSRFVQINNNNEDNNITQTVTCNNVPNDEITNLEVNLDPMIFLEQKTDSDNSTSTIVKEEITDSNNQSSDVINDDIKEIVNNRVVEDNNFVKIKIENDSTVTSTSCDIISDNNHILPDNVKMTKCNFKKKIFKCPVCPRKYVTSISLQNHLWKHLNNTRSRDIDDSKTIELLKNNVFNKLMDTPDLETEGSNLQDIVPPLTWNCLICHKKLTKKGLLKIHMETHNLKMDRFPCDLCNRFFHSKENLQKHKLVHRAVTVLQTPTQNKIRNKTRLRGAECNICGRLYPSNSTLKAHEITHSNERPYKCPLTYCDKSFKRNQDLKFHVNQHTGYRPYKCPYCPKTFTSSSTCFMHRKRVHSKLIRRVISSDSVII